MGPSSSLQQFLYRGHNWQILRRMKDYSACKYQLSPLVTMSADIAEFEKLHDVQGIICREVHIDIEVVGSISILEATADSQNHLVDMALATEEEIATVGSSPSGSLQLTTGDPYGAVLWPAASDVANHLLTTNNITLENKTMLELGAGTGLVSISAALGGMSKIRATDYENVPLKLLQYASTKINHQSHDDNSSDAKKIVSNEERKQKLTNIETFLFDICDHNIPLPSADFVVAADIMYEPKTGIAMAYRVVEALKVGSRVIVGCSPGRPGRPRFIEKLRELLPNTKVDFVGVNGTTCSGPRNELICGKDSTSISSKPKLLKVELLDLSPECLNGSGKNK